MPEEDASSDPRSPRDKSNLPVSLSYIIALGGNMFHADESRGAFVRSVVVQLGREIGPVEALSRLYRTPAFPAGSGEDFVNAALILRSDTDPETLLAQLHEVEHHFGRERKKRWGPRRLDLDLIAAGDCVLPDEATLKRWRDLPLDRQMKDSPDRLLLPHPRLQERAFVLVPVKDVAPGWRHPILGLTVTQMCDALPPEARAEVTPLPESACLLAAKGLGVPF
ncbi:2-amino-4-hydroxy-6-hydroxymethyldihydropteridine diphosphokinase [Pseudooceanicola algae]|uniref:2-amino-4-hydroxy-6-hydroxymethyldihydropteridine pyrophosphokinase n=1 Tax=Pseudooceanicola algae TaxID=1537215 RepID=A0A418SGC2_9RHOB|nr:2-amino-4-hydroxy-6-hydroxymethyldihydropteridine diphosphokinase [Pseudooceanicola algae]QPM91724.1 hypothetical protein PSAL_029790 [Pseudooceanicola algae]